MLGHLSCRGLRSAELHLDVFLRMWFPEQRCVEIIKKEVLARSYSRRSGFEDQMPLHRSTMR